LQQRLILAAPTSRDSTRLDSREVDPNLFPGISFLSILGSAVIQNDASFLWH
jgi:hypothetical protein